MINKLEGRNTVVAVDPSFTTMGVAIFQAKKVIAHKTGKFQQQIAWIRSIVDLKDCIFIIENPDLDSKAFSAHGQIMTACKQYRIGKLSEKMLNAKIGMALRQAQDVGKSKQSALLLIDMLNTSGIPYFEVAPSERNRGYKWVKNNDPTTKAKLPKLKHHFEGINLRQLKMPTKLNAQQVEYWTQGGFNERCSEHVRDAVTLFHGRSLVWLKNSIKIQHAKREASKQEKKKPSQKKLFQNA